MSTQVKQIAFNKRGDRLVTVSFDTTAAVWDVGTCTRIMTFKGHKDYVSDDCVVCAVLFDLSPVRECFDPSKWRDSCNGFKGQYDPILGYDPPT